jgi:hypothetical protein
VAISLLAKHGSDSFLLNLVEILYDTLQEEVGIAEKRVTAIFLFLMFYCKSYIVLNDIKMGFVLALLCHKGHFFLKHLILNVTLKCN